MAIPFQCSKCGTAHNAPDNLAGRKIKCKGCGSVEQVPKGAGQSPAKPAAPASSKPGAAKPGRAAPRAPVAPQAALSPAQPAPDPFAADPFAAANPYSALTPYAQADPYAAAAPDPFGAAAGPLGHGAMPPGMQPHGMMAAPPLGAAMGGYPPPRSGMSPAMMVILIVGGLFAFGGIAVVGVVFWAMSSSRSEQPVAVVPEDTQQESPFSSPEASSPAPSTAQPVAMLPSARGNADPVSSVNPTDIPSAQLPIQSRSQPDATTPGRARPTTPGRPLSKPLSPDPADESLRFTLDPSTPVTIPMGNSSAVHPTTLSPFVGLAGGRGHEVWDLRTCERTGRLEPSQNHYTSWAMISPDGRYMAFHRDEVYVSSFETGQQRQITPNGKVQTVDFAGPDEVALFTQLDFFKNPWQVTVVNIDNGQTVSEFATRDGDKLSKDLIALSPGRRYMATCGATGLCIYDMSSGDVLSQVATQHGATAVGVVFSPEGDELAIMAKPSVFEPKIRILAWNLQSGQQTANWELEIERQAGYYSGRPLEALPGQRGWLVEGLILVDRASGKQYYELPKLGSRELRRAVGPNQFLMVEAVTGTGSMLNSFVLTEEQIAAANVTLPQAARADASQATTIELPSGTVAWTAEPDPAPADSAGLLRNPMLLQSSAEHLLTGCVSGLDAAQLVTTSSEDRRFPHNRQIGLNDAVWLDHYDLAAGLHVGRIDLPRGSVLLDITLDGTRILLRRGARLDVISLEDGKHLAGWLPTNQADAQNNDNALDAAFADGNHVMTEADGETVLWKLPECTAVYRVANLEPSRAALKRHFSPARKYFFGMLRKPGQPAVGLLFESLTGQLRGVLSLPKIATELIDVAFRPDGEQLAMGTQFGVVRMTTVADLKRGTTLEEAPGKQNGGTYWAGRQHLLLGPPASNTSWATRTTLFDVGRRIAVATCNIGSSQIVADTSDGRIWRLTSDRFERDKLYLASATVPDQALIQKISANAGLTQVVVGSGMAVSLSIQASGVDAGKVRSHLTQKLKEVGIEVKEGQPVQLVAKSQTGKSTTHELSVTKSGMPSETRSVTQTPLECSVQFVIGGQVQWSTDATFMAGLPIGARFGTDAELQQILSKAEQLPHDRVEKFLLDVNLPPVVYGPPAKALEHFELDQPASRRAAGVPLAAGRASSRLPIAQGGGSRASGLTPVPESTVMSDKDHREQIARAYLDVVKKGKWERLRGTNKLGRPAVTIRWALGTETSSSAANRDAASFSNYSGRRILEGLPAPGTGEHAMLGMGGRGKLLASARRYWADLLLMADIDSKPVGRTARINTTITVRVLDVASGEELWASDPLKKLDPIIGRQFADYVLASAKKEFSLEPLTSPTATTVANRVEALGKKEFVHPLAALAEVGYYRDQELLTEEVANKLYGDILGPDEGGQYAEADAEKRSELIDKWLPGWIAEE